MKKEKMKKGKMKKGEMRKGEMRKGEMRKRWIILLVSVISCIFISCKKADDGADKLLNEIQKEYDAGNYQAALSGIDSLRRNFPKAVEARKTALVLWQQASLKMAQEHLAVVDSTIQAMDAEYNVLSKQVAAHRASGTATASELQQFNLLKAKRDSMKGVFDVECAKIKYIHKRQKQLE